MQIGIIGGGSVGGTLGTAWARKGHKVRFGVRHPGSPEMSALLKKIGSAAAAGTVAEAVSFGEVVVMATPWPATFAAIQAAGDLREKVLLDCTNPLKPQLAGLEAGTTTSGGEMVAEWATGARVVKIFNTTGYGNMANPDYPLGPVTMFYCGDDEGAKVVAAKLASDIGFEPIDAGPLRQARLLEPMAMLWIWLAVFGGLGTDFAFRLMRR
jgi:8-hydroxy-5-deazaflavin:NADPH oxidoreductase